MKNTLLLLTITFSLGVFAQSNLSFETWSTGHPTVWDLFGTGNNINDFASVGDPIDQNSNVVIPATEQTDNPTDGNSYLRLTSFEMTNSFDPVQVPDGPYGSVVTQSFNDANVYSNFTFDVKYDVIQGDAAILIFQALDASENIVAQGTTSFTGSTSTWENITMNINVLNNNPIVQWQMTISSSVGEVSNTFNGSPAPNPEPGSVLDIDNIQLGPVVNPVPNVTNIVASDIADNGNGSDLQVTFDVPQDETNIVNYYAVVFVPGLDMALLNNPLNFVSIVGQQLTPDGSNKTLVFDFDEDYWAAQGVNLQDNPIVNNQPLVVWIYVEAGNGFDDVFAASNQITLTSPANISEGYEKVQVYPNPAKDVFSISIEGFEFVEEVVLYNAMGQKVMDQKINAAITKIDVSSLSEGLYIYQLVNTNGEVVKVDRLSIVK